MKKCLRCSNTKLWVLNTGQYRCSQCRYTWTPRRSFWESARFSPQHRARLVEYFCLGVPAYRLRFIMPLSQKTIQRWYRLLRCCLYQRSLDQVHILSGIVEMDETMFGGRRPGQRGWGAAGKTLVFGIYKRNGQVLTFPVSSRGRQALEPLISQHTRAGSLYYTDDWHAYASLALRGTHVVVSKQKGIPKGRAHINGIEGFWSYAKHWLYTYRGVGQNYFPLYLKEVEWRFNHRHENLIPLLKQQLKTTLPDKQLVQLWV